MKASNVLDWIIATILSVFFFFFLYQSLSFNAASGPEELIEIRGTFADGDYQKSGFRKGPRHRISLKEHPSWFYITAEKIPSEIKKILVKQSPTEVVLEIHQSDQKKLAETGNVMTYGVTINGHMVQDRNTEMREKWQIKWLWLPGAAVLMLFSSIFQIRRGLRS